MLAQSEWKVCCFVLVVVEKIEEITEGFLQRRCENTMTMELEGDFPVPKFPVIFRFNNDDDDARASDSEVKNDSEETIPAIFTKDPREWTRYVDHHVEILLDDGATKSGVVHVIDPVSEAVVLVNFVTAVTQRQTIKVEILPGLVVQKIFIVKKADTDVLEAMAKAFGDEVEGRLSEEEVTLKRERVKEWLIANRIPVDVGGVKGDVIEVAGKALIIKPPYDVDNCFSLNEIILKKVQQLLMNQPK